MRQSFGFLSSVLVVLFLVSDAMAQMPERCTDLFGTAPEFELCDGTDETCSFNARTDGGTCGEMCASLGSYCVAAQSNDGPDRCVDSGNPDTCTTPRGTEICTCARPVAEPPPPPSCADLFRNAPEFQLCDGSDTTCSFNVRTNNERTCTDVCESVEGSTCAGAIDNEGSSCIERLPGVSSNGDDSCTSQQNTSICICNRPGVEPEPTPTTVFVTSETFTGNLGGLDGADEKCQRLATAAGLGGTFKAWLSTANENAKDRIPQEGPYQLVNGTVISDTLPGLLDNAIDAPILVDESLNRPVAGTVYTGTGPDGIVSGFGSFTCGGWTSAAGCSQTAVIGENASTTRSWTAISDFGDCNQSECSFARHIYCFGR